MRVKVIWRLATVLMISRLRSFRQSTITRTISGRPILVLVIGLAVLIVGLLIGFLVSSFVVRFARVSSFVSLQSLAESVASALPLFLVTFYFVMGLVWEVNASSEAESTDAVNWLPISSTEYVAASSMSTAYTYSPIMMGMLGFALPVFILAAGPLASLYLLIVALLATAIGSVGVEILRSALSRASSSFYRVGGKAAIILRLVAVSLVFISTQAVFNGYFFLQIAQSAGSGGELIPVFWPSLSIVAALHGNLLELIIFLGLSLGFFILLGETALFLRGKYWVVASSSSPKLSSYSSIVAPGKFGILHLSPVLAALLRYEFRSATRRRELLRLVVLPVMIPMAMIFPLFFALGTSPPGPGRPPPPGLGPAFFSSFFLFGVGIAATVLAMTSIGREGKRIWNFCALPITGRELARAKFLFTFLICLVGLVLTTAVTVLLSGFSPAALSLLLAGLGLIVAETGFGLAIAARYPDFSEAPRPRFVTVTGSIIGSLAGILLMGLVLAPVFVSAILRLIGRDVLSSTVASTISAMIGLLLGWATYKLSISPLDKILSELPA